MAKSFTGRKRIRKSFGRIPEVAPMPNLIEVQKSSYDHFLQMDVAPESRASVGLPLPVVSAVCAELRRRGVVSDERPTGLTAAARAEVGRSAGPDVGVCPTCEGIGLVIPELQGRFGGMSFRVPTSTVSVIDFTALLEASQVTKDEINAAMREYAGGRMHGILDYTEQPLVSTDLRGDEHSSIFSAMDTLVVGGNLVKVISWYDNEWGYACRVADLAHFIGERM